MQLLNLCYHCVSLEKETPEPTDKEQNNCHLTEVFALALAVLF
jgi:hypothetical protein